MSYHLAQDNSTFLPSIRFIYTDGTVGRMPNPGTAELDISITSEEGKTIDRISLAWNTQTGGGLATFSDIHLRKVGDTSNFVENEQKDVSFPMKEGQVLREEDYTADDGIHCATTKVELDGTETVYLESNTLNNVNRFYVKGYLGSVERKIGLCTHFPFIQSYNLDEEHIYVTTAGYIYIFANFNTADELKQWLANQKTAETPVTIEYPLAEEEIEEYSEAQQTAYNQMKDLETYRNVTNIFCKDETSCEFETTYYKDLATMLTNQNQLIIEGGN